MYTTVVFPQNYKVTRYADNNGLPSRIVHDVIQDSNGFIWVAGNNGLYRFDGQEFKPYLASLKDTVGLRDNKINTILETKDGKLWIGTPKGLHTLENNLITHIPLLKNATENEEYILNVFEDSNANLWIATYGGIFFRGPDEEIIHLLEGDGKEIAVSKGTVWSVTEDRLGNIWAAANDELYLKNTVNRFLFDKVNLQYHEDLQEIDIGYYRIQQYNDSLYIIDSSHGLLKGKLKGNFLAVSQFLNVAGKKEGGYTVEGSIIDRNGSIWLANWKHEIKKFSIAGERLVEQKIVAKNGFLAISDASNAVFQDRQNNVWFANTNGLYKFSIDESEISTFPPYGCLDDFKGIYAMIEDGGGNLWVTTPTKLYKLKKQDVLENKCPIEYLVFAESHMQQARNLFIDSTNRLWIGADGGLFVTQLDDRYQPGTFKRYTVEDGLPHNHCHEIYEVEDNVFWVGNYLGLVHLNLKNGDMEKPLVKVFTADKKENGRLVNTQAMHIEHDENDNIWIGTFSGVSRLLDDSGAGTFENYTNVFGNPTALSNNSIKKIFKDSNDNLWIATQRGLNLYAPEEDEFLQFGHAEGMPSEYILGIQEDMKGNLWIGTTNGILKAKFDNASKTFVDRQHYTTKDGLVDNIPYRNAIWIDTQDNVFIGSRDGITIFSERCDLGNNNSSFQLALTNVESIGKKHGGFQPIDDRVKKGSLKLSHIENSLKIRYAALDFQNPGANQYRHKFLPLSNTWIETGNLSELTYYNLPSGEYEIILDGANSLGQWSNNAIKLHVTIKPPFWRSPWAYALYLVLFSVLLRLFYLARVRKKEWELEQKNQLETALIKEREQLRQENAADFHDELGSMVTKISMFLTMAERNWTQGLDPTPFFNKIRYNVKGLSTGFRDLLWVIDPQKDSLGDTFLRLKEFGEEMFEQSSIDFRSSTYEEHFSDLLLSPMAKKQLILIFKEAMTNGLKYSTGTKAELNLKSDGQFSVMEFLDDGKGFDVASRSKGRGLKNMKTRSDTIGAVLTITSTTTGTLIRLERIPHLGDTCYPQDQ
ncbi:MAG: two-component regulator propeller domain-containing protein [Bacteroidota bacterium]